MILIALGANLPGPHGGPRDTILAAHGALAGCNARILTSSRIWLTAPVPVSDQPWYHNQVVAVETDLKPLALLETLQDIERAFGRQQRAERNAARILDLDLIAYHDEIVDRPELIIPHPRAHERAFVLLPLREIAPEWVHPVLKTPLPVLLAALPEGQEVNAPEEVEPPRHEDTRN